MRREQYPWLDGTGPDADLVVSSRVRLARNLAARPFTGRSAVSDREAVVHLVEAALGDLALDPAPTWHRLDAMGPTARRYLHEAQLASRELAGTDAHRVRSGAAVVAAGDWAVLCNEEDHLRIHALRAGLAPEQAWGVAKWLDDELGRRISFAFHPEFGYLTSCPTNVGTGLRASVLIHLPALVLTREIGKVLQGLAQVGLTHRGMWGEGSEVRGNLFQLSNQVTLGKSEGELLEHLGRLVAEVIAHERRAREVLQRDATTLVEDRVWRAWGVLLHARALELDETLNLLGGVRLGVAMGTLPAVPWGVLNRLLVEVQDAHVAREVGGDVEGDALLVARATLVRRMLQEERTR